MIARVQHVFSRRPLKFPQASHPPAATAHPTRMLLRTALLCLLSANVVVSQFIQPAVLAEHGPGTALKTFKDQLESKHTSDTTYLVDGLLFRQSECSDGYAECTDYAGRLVLHLPSPPAFVSLVHALLSCSTKHERSWVLIWIPSHRCCPQGGSCCSTDGKPTLA